MKIEAKTQNKIVEFYRFIKDWKISGLNVSKGVSLKGEFNVSEDCVSLVGSSVFRAIPLECLEKYEPIKYQKKTRNKKQIEATAKAKTSAESARISDRVDMLKDKS